MEIKYRLIVIAPAGLKILDTPRPQSMGSIARRVVPVGTSLNAYDIFKFDGVEYAYLEPQKPNAPEWVRVGEIQGAQYVAKIATKPDGPGELSDIAAALREIAQAIKNRVQ